jgi:ankyrin repeat protein
VNVVAVLFASGKFDAHSNHHNGRKPLSHVSDKANGFRAATVKLLFDAGYVNVHSKDDFGRTTLSCATERGKIPVMEFLIGSGEVDVNSNDKSRRTHLSYLVFGIDFAAKVKLLSWF